MLSDEIGAHRLSSISLVNLARTKFRQGRQPEAERIAAKALTAAREGGITFFGAAALGVSALIAQDPEARRQALREGNEILDRGCHVTNYFEFRRDTAEIAIDSGEWSEALAQVEAWQSDFLEEVPPYAQFWASWTKALVKFGMGDRDQVLVEELNRLRKVAINGSVRIASPRIESALTELGA